MRENDNFILDIKRMGINGEGIGFYNKKAIFVEGALPGEGHDVTITKESDKMAFAKSNEIKRASLLRKMPECEFYNVCGGCNTMHVDYNGMLNIKRDILNETVTRYTHLDTKKFEIKATIPSKPFGYKNRSLMGIREYDNEIIPFTLKAKSNDLGPVKVCKLNDDVITRLNNEILSIAKELEIPVYLPKYNRGVLKQLLIRTNSKGEALVLFICVDKNKKLVELAERVAKLKGVKSVYESFITDIKSKNVLGDEINHLAGSKFIVEELGKAKVAIYPDTQYRINSSANEAMYEAVLKSCKMSLKERVLDLNSGIGTLSLYLSKLAKEVVGVEYSKDLISKANDNAKLSKATNVKFLQGDSKELLPKLVNDEAYDIIVTDAARTGLGYDLVEAINKSNVKKVIYVSNNPASFAKDLDQLSEKYNVNSLTPVDVAPQTAQVEVIAVLSLKK